MTDDIAQPFSDKEVADQRQYILSRAARDHWHAAELELVDRMARWLATVDVMQHRIDALLLNAVTDARDEENLRQALKASEAEVARLRYLPPNVANPELVERLRRTEERVTFLDQWSSTLIKECGEEAGVRIELAKRLYELRKEFDGTNHDGSVGKEWVVSFLDGMLAVAESDPVPDDLRLSLVRKPELHPAESIAFTIAKKHYEIGEDTGQNTVEMLVLCIERLTGQHDWTEGVGYE